MDFVGLWLAVPGGPHDLPAERWRALAERAAGSTDGPAPVLVTFTKDAELLREALERSPVDWVQLHGYPTPGFVRKVKAIGPDSQGDQGPARPRRRVRRGVADRLLREGGRRRVPVRHRQRGRPRRAAPGWRSTPTSSRRSSTSCTRPFLLAGGISAENRERYEHLAAHPLFLGIDVDTNARGADGKISAEQRRGDHPRLESPQETANA